MLKKLDYDNYVDIYCNVLSSKFELRIPTERYDSILLVICMTE